LDPTAGKRARQIRRDQGTPQRIIDPTDPRCAAASPADFAGTPKLILDPTNPRCEESRRQFD
jgi:hypothetical protein